MASGRITLTVDSSGYYSQVTGWIDWQESDPTSSAAIASNKTTVSAKLYYKRPADGAGRSGWGESHFTLTINGETFTYQGAQYIESGETIEIPFATSPSVEVSHNTDGTKSIQISGGGYLGSYSGQIAAIQSSSGSATVALGTIPRASEFGTIIGSTIGSAMTIGIDAKAAFWHKVTYSFSGTSGTAATGTAGTTDNTTTTVSWTPPIATFGPKIPNNTSGVCTLTLTTYSNSAMTAQVGSAVTKDVTLTMPSTALPTLSNITKTDTVSANDTAKFIQAVTAFRFGATVGGSYGSTIASVKFTFEGVTKNATVSGTTATSETFPIVSNSGELLISATVTDSRGRSRTLPSSVDVIAYTKPKISSSSAKRNTSTPTTLNCKISASASTLDGVASAKQNTMACYALYALKTADYPNVGSGYQFSTTGLSATNVTKTYTSALQTTASYKVRIMVVDKFYTVYKDFSIGTAAVVLDINEDGKLGVGKYNEYGTLDVNGPAQFYVPGASGGGEAKTIILPPTYSATAVGTTSGATDYYQKLLAKICQDFSGTNLLLFGATQPASRGILLLFIYNTAMVDQTTGLPQYSHGLVIPYGSSAYPFKIGTANYTYYELTLGGGGGQQYVNGDEVSY